MNTRIPRSLAATLLALGCCVAPASADMAPGMAHDGILTDSAGMSLYTFDKDPADGSKSACNGPCAENWPPLMAAAGAKAEAPWSVLTRDDGSMQYAYHGKPLYRWTKDSKPGDRSGDGFKDIWHLARP